MANLGPLFATTRPPEERKLSQGIEKPAATSVVVIDGKTATINWVSHEGRDNYEAGVSFNATDHSVWKLRKNPDGSWTPIRCALYGRRDLASDALTIAEKYTERP